jgi:hypothetical protein
MQPVRLSFSRQLAAPLSPRVTGQFPRVELCRGLREVRQKDSWLSGLGERALGSYTVWSLAHL